MLLHWWHYYFLENLIKSFSASEHDVWFVWQVENNFQRNQNSFKVSVNHFTRSTSWWFWHDFFKEKNCSSARFIFSKNSEKFWDLFRTDWLISTIHFLLCSTNWIIAEQKNSTTTQKIYSWSDKKKLFEENTDFWC